MRTLLLTIGLLLATGTLAFGQSDKDARERIKATRIAMITEKLGLTAEQAQQFWPVYNEFIDRREQLVVEYRQAERQAKERGNTEEDQRKLLTLRHTLKQRELNLEKDYSERLLNVIDTRQLSQLRAAEEDFRQMVREYIQRREVREQRIDNIRQRQQQRDRRNGG